MDMVVRVARDDGRVVAERILSADDVRMMSAAVLWLATCGGCGRCIGVDVYGLASMLGQRAAANVGMMQISRREALIAAVSLRRWASALSVSGMDAEGLACLLCGAIDADSVPFSPIYG